MSVYRLLTTTGSILVSFSSTFKQFDGLHLRGQGYKTSFRFDVCPAGEMLIYSNFLTPLLQWIYCNKWVSRSIFIHWVTNTNTRAFPFNGWVCLLPNCCLPSIPCLSPLAFSSQPSITSLCFILQPGKSSGNRAAQRGGRVVGKLVSYGK